MTIIVLDKDGTLLDAMDAVLDGFVKTSRIYAAKDRVIEVITNNAGSSPDSQFSLILNLPTDSPLVLECVEKLWEFLKNKEVEPFEDALEVVPRLANDGHTLVLSSGYRPDITKVQLEKVGLIRYFDLILGHTPPIVKGELHMKAIMQKYGLGQEEMKQISIVGDGTGDMKMGHGYTQRLYGIDRGGNSEKLIKAGATQIFPDLRKFYEFFSKEYKPHR